MALNPLVPQIIDFVFHDRIDQDFIAEIFHIFFKGEHRRLGTKTPTKRDIIEFLLKFVHRESLFAFQTKAVRFHHVNILFGHSHGLVKKRRIVIDHGRTNPRRPLRVIRIGPIIVLRRINDELQVFGNFPVLGRIIVLFLFRGNLVDALIPNNQFSGIHPRIGTNTCKRMANDCIPFRQYN